MTIPIKSASIMAKINSSSAARLAEICENTAFSPGMVAGALVSFGVTACCDDRIAMTIAPVVKGYPQSAWWYLNRLIERVDPDKGEIVEVVIDPVQTGDLGATASKLKRSIEEVVAGYLEIGLMFHEKEDGLAAATFLRGVEWDALLAHYAGDVAKEGSEAAEIILGDAGNATGIAPAELAEMAAAAGTAALRDHFDERGEIMVPLRMVVVPKGNIPLFFPAADVDMLNEICTAADVSGYLQDILRSNLVQSIEGIKRGHLEGLAGDIKDGYTLDDPDARESAMFAVLEKWEADGEGGVRRKAVA